MANAGVMATLFCYPSCTNRHTMKTHWLQDSVIRNVTEAPGLSRGRVFELQTQIY